MLHQWRDQLAREEDESPRWVWGVHLPLEIPSQAAVYPAFVKMGRRRCVANSFVSFDLRYVLPDHMMLELATRAPPDAMQILACCQPIPPLVRLNVNSLQEVSPCSGGLSQLRWGLA